MTHIQAFQFNSMRKALLKISKEYLSPEQLRKKSQKLYGLDFEEAMEMSYDNIRAEAADAVHKIKVVDYQKEFDKRNKKK